MTIAVTYLSLRQSITIKLHYIKNVLENICIKFCNHCLIVNTHSPKLLTKYGLYNSLYSG